MNLPELPKKYKRTESKIDGRVADWFYKNHPRSVLCEVKMIGGKVSEHQQRLLDTTGRTGKFKYKFPDGGRRTPLDFIVMKEGDAALCWCDEKGNCVCEINKKYKIKIKV